jgi:hypothetical protein
MEVSERKWYEWPEVVTKRRLGAFGTEPFSMFRARDRLFSSVARATFLSIAIDLL